MLVSRLRVLVVFRTNSHAFVQLRSDIESTGVSSRQPLKICIDSRLPSSPPLPTPTAKRKIEYPSRHACNKNAATREHTHLESAAPLTGTPEHQSLCPFESCSETTRGVEFECRLPHSEFGSPCSTLSMLRTCFSRTGALTQVLLARPSLARLFLRRFRSRLIIDRPCPPCTVKLLLFMPAS